MTSVFMPTITSVFPIALLAEPSADFVTPVSSFMGLKSVNFLPSSLVSDPKSLMIWLLSSLYMLSPKILPQICIFPSMPCSAPCKCPCMLSLPFQSLSSARPLISGHPSAIELFYHGLASWQQGYLLLDRLHMTPRYSQGRQQAYRPHGRQTLLPPNPSLKARHPQAPLQRQKCLRTLILLLSAETQ